ncbi:MAG: XTP/dITP diphosphatase [Anaerolineae bacterium]|nr:XTP/dITP diphosphatase [Anaerolineae bacterium]
MKILAATHNKGKMREYAELLADLPVAWVSLSDVGIETDVEETGDTFEENACLKAATYACQSGLLTLADDSGLEVEALYGAPGVQSARYAGPGASDEDRYRLLLANLEGVPDEKRKARFVCVIAIATPHGKVFTAEGARGGYIIHEPRGEHGFGYDPVFWIPGYRATMAELEPEVKNRISHRALAVKAIRPRLERLVRYDSALSLGAEHRDEAEAASNE